MFRALNVTEIGWALVIVVALIIEGPPVSVGVAGAVAVAVLIAQLGMIRPRLNRRSDLVMAGEDVPRSSSHHV